MRNIQLLKYPVDKEFLQKSKIIFAHKKNRKFKIHFPLLLRFTLAEI
nr:MAG TPA: hypothetical protein [Caudoviricetes sp.]